MTEYDKLSWITRRHRGKWHVSPTRSLLFSRFCWYILFLCNQKTRDSVNFLCSARYDFQILFHEHQWPVLIYESKQWTIKVLHVWLKRYDSHNFSVFFCKISFTHFLSIFSEMCSWYASHILRFHLICITYTSRFLDVFYTLISCLAWHRQSNVGEFSDDFWNRVSTHVSTKVVSRHLRPQT